MPDLPSARGANLLECKPSCEPWNGLCHLPHHHGENIGSLSIGQGRRAHAVFYEAGRDRSLWSVSPSAERATFTVVAHAGARGKDDLHRLSQSAWQPKPSSAETKQHQ